MQSRIIAALIVACLTAPAWAQDQPAVPQPLAPGADAPNFTAQTLEGAEISLTEWADHVVVLNFFVTWYRQAGTHLKIIEDLASKYGEDGLRAVSVSLDDEDALQEVRELVAGHELAHPVVFDPEQKIARLYGVRALPATFVIGADGKVGHYQEGYTEGDDERLEEAVASAMGVEAEPSEQEEAQAEPAPEEPEEPICKCFRRK